MPKQQPNISEKLSSMAPNWAQVGAMLDSKIVLGASKSEKKASKPMPLTRGEWMTLASSSLGSYSSFGDISPAHPQGRQYVPLKRGSRKNKKNMFLLYKLVRRTSDGRPSDVHPGS